MKNFQKYTGLLEDSGGLKTAGQSKLDVKPRLFHAKRLATEYGQSIVGNLCQIVSKKSENAEILCLKSQLFLI